MRYVRTNTSYETYMATVHIFKQRLRKRQYPVEIIDKTTHIVQYQRRQQYLVHSQPPHPNCLPPLFKCAPPPQYHFLKHLIPKDCNELHFRTPRFNSPAQNTAKQVSSCKTTSNRLSNNRHNFTVPSAKRVHFQFFQFLAHISVIQ